MNKKSHKLFLLSLVLVLGITNCSLFDEEKIVNVEIVTDKSSYALDSTTVISVNVTNQSDIPIYYICTCQIYLEELENNQVINSWMVNGFEECLAPVSIEVDETETFEIDIYHLNESGFIDNASFNETVNYRFKLDLFEDSSFDKILDNNDRISNTITIIDE